MVNGNIFLIAAICILLAVFCIPTVALETTDGASGRIIIKSLPLECEISFRGETTNKTNDLLALEAIPVGNYTIVFKSYDWVLEAEVKIEAGSALLVYANFEKDKVLMQPGVYTGKDGAPMVMIPEGEFSMGSSPESNLGERDESPLHTVHLDAFYVDVYEVTNELYGKFLDATGHRKPTLWENAKNNAPDQPVVGVIWDDAMAYCRWVGKRLPTEAEWEKAARGGLVGQKYPWGADDPTAMAGDGRFTGVTGAYPVGSFAPNGYGLYDMARNAWEWCSDWYGEDYYAESPEKNPTGPDSGDARILRGGSWFSGIPAPSRVAYRYSFNPKRTSKLIGFRCVLDVKGR